MACDKNKVLNPSTGRCVLKTGKIGKLLLQKDQKGQKGKKDQKDQKGKKGQNIKCKSNQVLNPNTGRCVLKSGKIGKSLLNKDIPIIPVIPKKDKVPIVNVSKLDINEDGFISIKEYLSKYKSTGPAEIKKGEFVHHTSSLNIPEFLLYLINDNKNIVSKIACLPEYYFCLYKNNDGEYSSGPVVNGTYKYCPAKPDKGITVGLPKYTRGAIFYYNAPAYGAVGPPLKDNIIISDNFANAIYKCKKANKEIVYVSLILINKDSGDHEAHANTIIINTVQKTIERFDPHGASQYTAVYNSDLIDNGLKNKFETILPDYKYIPLKEFCPNFGPQANVDAFGGLCLTWALMYGLLRILNPNLPQKIIVDKMLEGLKEDILNKVLRFQKYMITVLQKKKKSDILV